MSYSGNDRAVVSVVSVVSVPSVAHGESTMKMPQVLSAPSNNSNEFTSPFPLNPPTLDRSGCENQA